MDSLIIYKKQLMDTLLKRIRQNALVIRIRQNALVKQIRKNLFDKAEIDVIDFEDQVEADFRKLMKKNSGRRIIQFPMVFDILLCPEDYKSLEQSILGILPELIADFYGIIKEKRDNTPGSVVNVTNRYWQFRFSECEYAKIDGKEVKLEPGRIPTQASLYSDDVLNDSQVVVGRKTGSRETGSNTRSSFEGKAINLEILRGGMLLPNHTVVFGFNSELSQDLNDIIGSRVKINQALASITWRSIVSSKKSSHAFIMKESPITISGPKREGEESQFIMKIDVDKVEKDHIQIRYSEADKQFQICAFADGVIANEASIPISKSDSPIWHPLSRESEIIIRDNVSISFNAL